MEATTNKRNSLAIERPELAKQWHPTKNGELTPPFVTAGSGKKAWWICNKGHEWEAPIYNRTSGRGCPYCSGNKVCGDNSLQALYPDLAKQWHPNKNGKLTPNDVTSGTRKKVWWICEKGHEWEATIASRKDGNGCPFCSNQRVCAENSLQTLNPSLAKQWHPIKNGSLTPNDVTAGSNKKVWWICEKGHEWNVSVNSRNRTNSRCPYCTGRNAHELNRLQALNPELSKQWHPTKNGELTPKDVTAGSGKKVWWICEKGHNCAASIANRSKGRGCPVCDKENKTSFPEQAIYFYLKNYFNDTLNGFKHGGKWEIDVFIPSLSFGIEYDGVYYHKSRKAIDFKKENCLISKGIHLLRVKEVEKRVKNCYCEENVIYCDERLSDYQLNESKICG